MKALTNLLLLFTAMIISCNTDDHHESDLLHTDKAFNSAAQESGFGKAFIAYADNDAIIMQHKQLPLKGIAEIKQVYGDIPADMQLQWTPEKAELAQSGDLGYTFGTYTFSYQGETETGHYVTIWKRQKDGSWKYVLDTGTENP